MADILQPKSVCEMYLMLCESFITNRGNICYSTQVKSLAMFPSILYIWKILCLLNFTQMIFFFIKLCNIQVYLILCPENYLSYNDILSKSSQ